MLQIATEKEKTQPVLVRMVPELIDALDQRARRLTAEKGVPFTRSDVVRFAVYQYLKLKTSKTKRRSR